MLISRRLSGQRRSKAATSGRCRFPRAACSHAAWRSAIDGNSIMRGGTLSSNIGPMRALLPLLLSTALAAHGAPACPAVGDQAPRFSLPLARGGRISLGDLLVPKKPVL